MEKTVDTLIDKSFKSYRRVMDALVNDPKKRPASLKQLTSKHKEIGNRILFSYSKEKLVVAVSPHRPEFEVKLIERITDYFNSIIPLFQKLIEDDIQLLMNKSIETYNRNMKVTKSPPATVDDVRHTHNKQTKYLVSLFESEPKVKESREKGEYLQQLTSVLNHEFEEMEKVLVQKIEGHEMQKRMEEAVTEAADFFQTRTTAQLSQMENLRDMDFQTLMEDYKKKAIELFDTSRASQRTGCSGSCEVPDETHRRTVRTSERRSNTCEGKDDVTDDNCKKKVGNKNNGNICKCLIGWIPLLAQFRVVDEGENSQFFHWVFASSCRVRGRCRRICGSEFCLSVPKIHGQTSQSIIS